MQALKNLPIVLGLLSCGAAAADLPPPGVELVHIVSQPMRASALLGMEVRDTKGERVGTIDDLVFDIARNEVRHARIALQGFVNAKLLDLRLSLEKDHVLLLRSVPAHGPTDRPTARGLIQRTVHATDGTPLGVLDEALVDAHAGRVPFVLLRRHGKLHPLPLDALSVDDGKIELRLDPTTLQRGPAFNAAELEANLENSEFLRRHAEYADRLTAGLAR